MILTDAINAMNTNVGVFLNSFRKQMNIETILAIIPIEYNTIETIETTKFFELSVFLFSNFII
jgi:hypothetical protein